MLHASWDTHVVLATVASSSLLLAAWVEQLGSAS